MKVDQTLCIQARYKKKKSHSVQFSSSSLENRTDMYFRKFTVTVYKKVLILASFI